MNQNLEYIADTFREETFQLFKDIDYNNIDSVFRVFHTAKSSFALYEIDTVSQFIHKLEDTIVLAKDESRELSSREVEIFESAEKLILDSTEFLTENISDSFPEDITSRFESILGNRDSKNEKPEAIKINGSKFINIYLLNIEFDNSLMEFGNDPYSYLKELNDIGEIEAFSTLHQNIPDFREINPTSLYLKVEILLRTKESQETVLEIFEFIEDDINIEIIELYKIREVETSEPKKRGDSLQITKDKFKDILHSAEENSRDGILEKLFEVGFFPLNSLIESVRDSISATAKKLNKKIEFIFDRNSFEIDKNLSDVIREPLLHIARNGVDHGFKDRESGTITLSFKEFQKDGKPYISISLSDNGVGIDLYRVIEKAIEFGYEIPQKNIYSLLFLPSFTTSDSVSEISGRGVGLDVVKSRISEIGGDISINSKKGFGSTFKFEIPLSLLLLNGIQLSVGNTPLIIPIERVLSITTKRTKLPSINLGELLKESCSCKNGIIVEIDGEKIEILVDSIDKDVRLPMKFLSSYFDDLKLFSGYSIIEDGRVGFIVDIDSLKDSI